VPANVAESCGRRARKDEARLLQAAFGSACELEAELLLAGDRGYATEAALRRVEAALGEVKRMLGSRP
jgi:four helix bundle protein